MIKSLEVKVNPDVLKTLRESSGYTVEEIIEKKGTGTFLRTAGRGRRLEL